MKTVKTYFAEDGTPFTDKFECARHELQNPALIEKISASMMRVPYSHQRNWCGGDPDTSHGAFACGCMGCINSQFHKLDLDYAHWKIWLTEFRGVREDDEISHDTDVDIIMTDPGTNIAAIFVTIRTITGLGVIEGHRLMKTPNAVIRRCIKPYEAEYYIQKLVEAGATAKMKISE